MDFLVWSQVLTRVNEDVAGVAPKEPRTMDFVDVKSSRRPIRETEWALVAINRFIQTVISRVFEKGDEVAALRVRLGVQFGRSSAKRFAASTAQESPALVNLFDMTL